MRPLIYAQLAENILLLFIENVLTIPALIYHSENIIPDYQKVFHEHSLLDKALEILANTSKRQEIVTKLRGTQILALLGNTINLFELQPSGYAVFTVDICYNSNKAIMNDM